VKGALAEIDADRHDVHDDNPPDETAELLWRGPSHLMAGIFAQNQFLLGSHEGYLFPCKISDLR
jgi:hypothetical protein